MHGAYGVMVSTRACGARSEGSNPSRHPFNQPHEQRKALSVGECLRSVIFLITSSVFCKKIQCPIRPEGLWC